MANYITIDGGTTNTRISLVKDYEVIETLKYNVGARAGIDDNLLLKTTVKNGISKLLSQNGLKKEDITRILASGMITSEFGLFKLDHATTPIGLDGLHECMHEVVIQDISDIPFVFMRGVKTGCKTLEDADMMRGEETELMGIMSDDDGECVYILPGSHSKIIKTDSDGKIVSFATMLTGEMTAALSQNTILKASIEFFDTIDSEYLVKGYEYCNNKGINEALFKVRILKNIFGCESLNAYSFFMGVILCGEVDAVLKINPPKVVIGGKKQLKEALTLLIESKSDCEVVCVSDCVVDKSSVLGMIRIYEV